MDRVADRPSAANSRRAGVWARLQESLESRLWPVPVAVVVLAVVVGLVLPRVDLLVDPRLAESVSAFVFNGGPDTARSVLSAIAGSLITATSLTFSLTVVALQLASSQASPRVLRLFARDRHVHWTLAAFLGTFAYSVTVLRSVHSADHELEEFVPRMSVTLAFVLTLMSVVMLVLFLAHLAAQLRVETMLKEIREDTDNVIDRASARNEAARRYSGSITIPDDRHVVEASTGGFITGCDHMVLLHLATEHSVVVQEARRTGEHVVAGTPLAYWWSEDPAPDGETIGKAIRRAYVFGYERTASEDIDFGVQQISDIALRALSPGINDPTTAVNALGHLSALTARTVMMPAYPDGLADESGALRVVVVPVSGAERIHTALSTIRHYCADSPTVVARFVQAVDELAYRCQDSDACAALVAELDALEKQLRAIDTDPDTTQQGLALIADSRTRVLGVIGG